VLKVFLNEGKEAQKYAKNEEDKIS